MPDCFLQTNRLQCKKSERWHASSTMRIKRQGRFDDLTRFDIVTFLHRHKWHGYSALSTPSPLFTLPFSVFRLPFSVLREWCMPLSEGSKGTEPFLLLNSRNAYDQFLGSVYAVPLNIKLEIVVGWGGWGRGGSVIISQDRTDAGRRK